MRLKYIFPILITFAVILVFHYTKIYFIKFYPVAANLTTFLVFFASSFSKETVIQKFAKSLEGGILDDFTKNYTRKLTYIWCIITFINLIISIITVFLPEKWWALYNGCISYFAIGMVFVVEYIIRIVLRKKYRKNDIREISNR